MADQQEEELPQGPPNPLTKAAEASTLPRQARARIGATTDPVPEGKVVDASPDMHFKVQPASHNVERAQQKSAAELGLPEHMQEVALAHAARETPPVAQGRKDTQMGQDWQGGASSSQKKMDSRHRGSTNDYQGGRK